MIWNGDRETGKDAYNSVIFVFKFGRFLYIIPGLACINKQSR